MSKIKEVFINREEERKIFQQMLEGSRREHILLIQAAGDMGKTHLIDEFEALSTPYPHARIDLKAVYMLDRLMFGLCEDIGIERFPNFYSVCRRLVEGFTFSAGDNNQRARRKLLEVLTTSFNAGELRILCTTDLEDVRYENLRGETLQEKALALIEYMEYRGRLPELIELVQAKRPHLSLDIAQPRATEPLFSLQVWHQAETKLRSLKGEERSQQLEDLTGAYVEDLRQYCLQNPHQRVVILFDTYDRDKGGHEVKEWLTGSFLRMARLLSCLVVVVAGRDIPHLSNEAGDWSLKRELHELQLHHFKEFVERLQLTIEEQHISVYYRGSGGSPGLIAKILENLMAGETR